MTPEQEALIAAQERAAALRAAPRPALEAIWHALDAIPDPEIPVVSIVGLGIVRGVEWERADPSTLVVRVTPTYSGCPATELIMQTIRETLAAAVAAGAKAPDFVELWRGFAADPSGSTPAEFGTFLKADRERWAAVVKKAGVKID